MFYVLKGEVATAVRDTFMGALRYSAMNGGEVKPVVKKFVDRPLGGISSIFGRMYKDGTPSGLRVVGIMVRTINSEHADHQLMLKREKFKRETGAPIAHQIMAGEGRGVP